MSLFIENKVDPTEWDWFLEEKKPGVFELNWFIRDSEDIQDGSTHFSESIDLYSLNDIKVFGPYTIIATFDGANDYMVILKTSKRVTGPIKFAGFRTGAYTVIGA